MTTPFVVDLYNDPGPTNQKYLAGVSPRSLVRLVSLRRRPPITLKGLAKACPLNGERSGRPRSKVDWTLVREYTDAHPRNEGDASDDKSQRSHKSVPSKTGKSAASHAGSQNPELLELRDSVCKQQEEIRLMQEKLDGTAEKETPVDSVREALLEFRKEFRERRNQERQELQAQLNETLKRVEAMCGVPLSDGSSKKRLEIQSEDPLMGMEDVYPENGMYSSPHNSSKQKAKNLLRHKGQKCSTPYDVYRRHGKTASPIYDSKSSKIGERVSTIAYGDDRKATTRSVTTKSVKVRSHLRSRIQKMKLIMVPHARWVNPPGSLQSMRIPILLFHLPI